MKKKKSIRFRRLTEFSTKRHLPFTSRLCLRSRRCSTRAEAAAAVVGKEKNKLTRWHAKRIESNVRIKGCIFGNQKAYAVMHWPVLGGGGYGVQWLSKKKVELCRGLATFFRKLYFTLLKSEKKRQREVKYGGTTYHYNRSKKWSKTSEMWALTPPLPETPPRCRLTKLLQSFFLMSPFFCSFTFSHLNPSTTARKRLRCHGDPRKEIASFPPSMMLIPQDHVATTTTTSEEQQQSSKVRGRQFWCTFFRLLYFIFVNVEGPFLLCD